jgi:hypothetical protein
MSSVNGVRGKAAPSQGSDTDHGGDEDSRFPALFGNLIGGDGHPDAKQRLKPGLKSDAKPSKKDDGTPVALPNPLGTIPLDTFTPKAVETADLSPVPTLGELGADLSLSANAAAEPFAAESEALATGLHANQIAGPLAMPAEGAGIASAQPVAADQTSGTPPATGAPAEDVPAEDAPPDWTKLLDSAMASAAAPQGTGFHPATARHKVTSSEAPVPQLAAMDQNTPVPVFPVNGANVPSQTAPLAVPEDRASQKAQPAPLPRLEPDSLAPKGQPAATPAPAAPLPDSLAQAAVTSPDSINQGEAANLAFEAHLIPMSASEAPAKAGAPDRLPLAAADSQGKPAVAAVPAAGPSTALGTAPSTALSAGTPTDHQQDNAPSSGQDRRDNASERFRKTDAPQPPAEEVALTAGKAAQHMPVAPEPGADRVGGQLSGQAASSSGSNPLRLKETVELPSVPEPPLAPAAARDIRLEVNAGDRRVEVRLVERDGEVHVAVRTPDAHLAETLREDLPALSSRLSESGFRNETWHPGAGSTELHRQAEPAGGSSAQDSSGQPRQNGEQEPGNQQEARPKVPEEQLNRKEKGKDFEWLMSTLQ